MRDGERCVDAGDTTSVNETLFATLITVNGIAIIVTMCLLSGGMSELNPIAHHMMGIHPYIFVAYVFMLWGAMYYFSVHLANKIGGIASKAGTVCIAVSLAWLFVDAVHDVTIFLQVIG